MNDLGVLNTEEVREKAILMGTFSTSVSEEDMAYSMAELTNLAGAAELEVLSSTIQRRDKIEAPTYIGRGKVDELKMMAESSGADVIVVNTELSGAQIRNLSDITGVKVIDRTMLILDIFARRAMSHIAKMQVELAQYRYNLPRLKGLGSELSRTGGGIGTRGPGEQKLEVDRRRVNEKMNDLEKRLDEAAKKRQVTKQSRRRSEVKTVALVGYTNAGKSSIMNAFIDRYGGEGEEKAVFVKNMLFATLDTFHRRIDMPANKSFVLTDTVGFVSNLPHELVKAFASTLEEVPESDLIIHVVDASNPDYEKQYLAAKETLDKLGASEDRLLTVYNKQDELYEDFKKPVDGLMLSVKTGEGFEEFEKEILLRLFGDSIELKLVIPFAKSELVQSLMKEADVKSVNYEEDGTHIVCFINKKFYGKYEDFVDIRVREQ